jgi:glycosyltransferase involved in cell wall biosynthesis
VLVVAGLVNHPSFRNVAEDIIEVAQKYNIKSFWGPKYLGGRRRDYGLRPVIIGSLIDSNMHFYLSLFQAQPVRRLAYLTAEGPLDTGWWNPHIFNGYMVVANSYWTARWLTEAKIDVHAIIHHAYNPAAVEKALEKPLTPQGSNRRTVWLSYMGQIGPRKRIEIALDALRIAQRRTGYGIGLVTNAAVDAYLKPDDKKIVKMGQFGNMPRDRALALVAGSQYYMHLSRSEGFGMPALEARALGIPLIAVDMQPTTEFVPRKAAYWVPTRDTTRVDGYGMMSFIEHIYDVDEAADIMVQAYDTYLNHRDDYEEMKNACRVGVEEYAHTRMYRRLISLLGF